MKIPEKYYVLMFHNEERCRNTYSLEYMLNKGTGYTANSIKDLFKKIEKDLTAPCYFFLVAKNGKIDRYILKEKITYSVTKMK